MQTLDLAQYPDNTYHFTTIKERIKPFDLFFFKGGGVLSQMISLMQTFSVGVGDFTHVGVVVDRTILKKYKDYKLEKNKFYLLESKMFSDNEVPDVVSGRYCSGVQLRLLEDVINYERSNGASVAYCQLINNPMREKKDEWFFSSWFRRTKVDYKFDGVFEQYYGVKFDNDPVALLSAVFPILRLVRNKRDRIIGGIYKILSFIGKADYADCVAGWQFSSELVINVYQKLGIISSDFDARDVLPVDFFGCDKDGLPRLVEDPIYLH